MATETEGDGMGPQRPIDKEMDELSLTQALRDFEVANARVVDLTQRLVEMAAAFAEAERSLDEFRSAHADLERRHAAMQSSFAFRLASRIWALRNAIRA